MHQLFAAAWERSIQQHRQWTDLFLPCLQIGTAAYERDLTSALCAARAARSADAARASALEGRVASLEAALRREREGAARREADAKATLGAEVRELHEAVDAKLAEAAAREERAASESRRTLSEAAAALRDERDARREEMRQLASACTARLNELQAAVEDERVARLEREGKLLERFSRDVLRVHERIDAERASRATAVSEITRVCADAMAMARNAASVASEEQVQGQEQGRFSNVVLEELASLKRSVENEAEARQKEDAAMARALKEYGQALRDGLRIVAEPPPPQVGPQKVVVRAEENERQ